MADQAKIACKASDVHNLNDLTLFCNNAETGLIFGSLTALEIVKLDTVNGPDAMLATYDLVNPPSNIQFGRLVFLHLPAGKTEDEFKQQQAAAPLNRIFVIKADVLINGNQTTLFAFRPRAVS